MNPLGAIGARVLDWVRRLVRISGIAWGVLRLGFHRRAWTRPVRTVLARQIVFTGIDGLTFVSVIGIAAGISIVVQVQSWTARLGQSELLGPLLIAIVVREVGPLLVNFVVIGRSGTAMAVEMASMVVRDEVHALDSQGVEPMIYLMLPRALGMAVSVLGLTLAFILVSFLSGYGLGVFTGLSAASPALFAHSVIQALAPGDFVALLAKTLLPGWLTGVIACTEGLSIPPVATAVPQAASRTVGRAYAGLVLVSAIVDVFVYA